MKTAHYSAIKSDTNIVSISRVVPKTVSVGTFEELHPYCKLMNNFKNGRMDEATFTKFYNKALNKLNAQEVYDKLNALTKGEPILTCYCCETSTDFCHRSLIAKWLEDNLDVTVDEFRSTPPKSKGKSKRNSQTK